jgi:hypothetical protein
MKCRYPGCGTEKLQRFGMCNKHRKWVEKGYIDLECNTLKEIPKKVDYRFAVCRVEDCENRPKKRFFCLRHYSAFLEGIYLENGQRTRPLIRYSKDFQCFKCGKGGKITKGFCKTHYQQLCRGQIDYDGNELRRPKRMKYDLDSVCKVRGCNRKPRVRGFCQSHSEARAKGFYDESGVRLIPIMHKNAGRKCIEQSCQRGAVTKLLCTMHYYRKYRAKPRSFLNKGKECSALACKKEAYCKGLCLLHYGRRKSRIRAMKAKETRPS